jgi:hypothetical protein
MVARIAKPKTRAGAFKQVPEAKFALGTRPGSVRGKNPDFNPKASNTRDYGTKTPPAVALQPGNPIGPPAGRLPPPAAPALNGFAVGGVVGSDWKL